MVEAESLYLFTTYLAWHWLWTKGKLKVSCLLLSLKFCIKIFYISILFLSLQCLSIVLTIHSRVYKIRLKTTKTKWTTNGKVSIVFGISSLDKFYSTTSWLFPAYASQAKDIWIKFRTQTACLQYLWSQK